jgi:dolichol-phosphate mannosyltransferase
MKPTVSVIVVVRNEESTIERVIEEAFSVLPTVAGRFEVLVNEDASTDHTLEILHLMSRRYKQLRVTHQKKRIGIAQGLELLDRKTRYQYVFDLPGDGQYSAHDLPAMLTKAINGCDIVVGRRIRKQYTWERKIISFLFNGLSYAFFRVRTFDAGSIKLYRRSIITQFQPLCRGVYKEAERIIRASDAGYKICWSPVVHLTRSSGVAAGAKPELIREAAADMIRLWWFLRVRRVSPVTLK